MKNLDLEKMASFCKRVGFIYPSSEIYGGLSAIYDYGHYGSLLKDNIRSAWLKSMIQERDDVFALDSAIFTHPKAWVASGHVGSFSDVLVEDKVTNIRYRADHLIEEFFEKKGDPRSMDKKTAQELAEIIKEFSIKSPQGNDLTDPRDFNLMLKTNLGSTDNTFSDDTVVYARAETCAGIYLQYKNIVDTMHPKMPFGVAQIGKAFRNEIVARQFVFRTREFEQMEMQYFLHPNQMSEKFEEWKKYRWNWYLDYGIPKESMQWFKHEKLAHYASDAYDIEYFFSTLNGYKEVEGIHARGDWDLSQHSKFSGVNLEFIDDIRKERYIPHIMETSAGLSRHVLMFIDSAYTQEDVGDGVRTVLKFDKRLAPIKVAVLPLMKKDGLAEKAKAIHEQLKTDLMCEYDASGSIGKRYRRQDEIGTPYCVTVDYQTLEDGTVTLRERDSMKQTRIKIDDLDSVIDIS